MQRIVCHTNVSLRTLHTGRKMICNASSTASHARIQRRAFHAGGSTARSKAVKNNTVYTRSRVASVGVFASSLVIKDETSGVEFPLGQRFWFGDQMRCLGAGTRIKKVLVFNAKVYSVALYVEGTKAAKELGIRERGGFFETDDDYCQAIVDGAQNKAIVIRLVRDVEGAAFAEAMEKYLAPRMQLIGDMASLEQFNAFLSGSQLTNGTEIAIFWSVANDVQVSVSPAAVEDYSKVQPPLSIASAGLGRALFELFLGSTAVVPDARKAWVEGIKNLLDYENVKRSTRKDGA